MPEADPTPVLATRAKTGDERAREQLVLRLQPLVAGLAGRFAGRAARADLEQAGMVGVLDALARYDPDQGPFEPYATPFAVGEMLKLARSVSAPVRVPRELREAARAVEDAVEALTGPDGRGPTIPQIAERSGLDEEMVVEAMRSRMAMRPLPAQDVPLHQLGSSADELAAAETRLELGSRLERLDGRSRQLIDLRFGLGLSQREIATRMGISQMHVSRLLRAALQELEAED